MDGDTLVVMVGLGFGVEVDQALRLRGIDSPELSRQAGARAREMVGERYCLLQEPCQQDVFDVSASIDD